MKNSKTEDKKEFFRERIHEELTFKNNRQDAFVLKPPIPKSIMVDLTNACNHRCIFCTSRFMTRPKRKIGNDLFNHIIRQARELGITELGLYLTGEPFLHNDLPKFISEAKRIGFKYVYLSTNGSLANEERSKRVIDAGLDSIKFSLNAGTPSTYKIIHGVDDWVKVFNNIRFIFNYRERCNFNLSIYLSSVITKITMYEKINIEEKFREYVDDILFVQCGSQLGQMLANEGELYDESVLQDRCSLPFNRMHVTCEGYLTVCCVEYQNYLAVADLKKVGLNEAWKNEVFQKIRQRHLENNLSGTLCGNCLSNKNNDIEPLCKELATKVDFLKLYEKAKIDIESRCNSSEL